MGDSLFFFVATDWMVLHLCVCHGGGLSRVDTIFG